MVEHRLGALDWLFVALSSVGFAGLLWIALAPLLAYASRRAVFVSTALTAATVWSADLLAIFVKLAVDRQRPYVVVPEADPLLRADLSSSFPSGHAATSFAGAVILSYLFRRGAPVLALLAVAVSFSRAYVGVHYPLDLLAGAALGAAVALTVVLLLRARRPTSGARPRSERAPPGG